jgi:hypothetical protein
MASAIRRKSEVDKGIGRAKILFEVNEADFEGISGFRIQFTDQAVHSLKGGRVTWANEK